LANTSRRPDVAVFGIGNPDRGDDAAGRIVADLLRGRLPADVEVVEHDGEGASLLARLEGLSTAILVDACWSGVPAGTVSRFDVQEAPLPRARFGISTHDFGLAAAIELGRALGQLPERCIVFAIEGAEFVAGAPLSPRVAAAIDGVVRRVIEEVRGAPAGER